MTTPVSSIVLVLIGSVIGSAGAVFLKSGALVLRPNLSSIVFNWRLALGIITYMLSSILFVKGMSNGELSVLFPMVSLGYICTLAWSRLFFREVITRAKVMGIGLILAGIVCLSLSNK
ncbi:MAG TPA: EamA family transporter [Bryobacteraceae bacterium]|nr:EamA family transporter [Bryobacteraceae bacterium]